MGLDSVEEIERAIDALSPQELTELSTWLDHHHQPLDEKIEADLDAGRLDSEIEQALNEEKSGRTRAL
jgi:hypothetical protein